MQKNSFYYKRLLICLELQQIRSAILKIHKLTTEIPGTNIAEYIQGSKLGAMNKFIDKVYSDVHVMLNHEIEKYEEV